MAIRFFWRCEGTTLDGTHDYSVGDTTVALTANAALTAAGAKVGINGLIYTGVDAYAEIDPTSVASLEEGAAGFWYQWPNTWGQDAIFLLDSGEGTDRLILAGAGTSGVFELQYTDIGEGGNTVSCTTSPTVTDTWYFIVLRWKRTGNLRLEIYNSDLTLRDSAQTAITQAALTAATRLKIGNYSRQFYIDNVFIADDYDEPLEDFADITSYTEYGGGATAPSKSLGLLLRGCG